MKFHALTSVIDIGKCFFNLLKELPRTTQKTGWVLELVWT